MQIVLAAQISGTRDGKVWPAPGTVLELPDDEARALVRTDMALLPDDPRVERLGKYIATDTELAGAPTGRDITEGQPDTVLSRSRALTQEHGTDADAIRATTREAAERIDYTDELTVPVVGVGAGPTVGDDAPAPAQTPGAAEANPDLAKRTGEDTANEVEAATARVSGTERAVRKSAPARER